jgi:phosphoglycolate phosphatase-like HAD superfamily hydrolase
VTHSRTLLAVDLDGTLINTRGLVVEAYRLAGVNPPDEAWGRRWQDWLPNAVGGYARALTTHTSKTQIYVKLLGERDLRERELPAAQLVREARAVGQATGCITASTFTTAKMILTRLDLGSVPLVAQVTSTARVSSLRGALDSFDRVIYVDDHADNVALVRTELPQIHTVHYRYQTCDELRRELRETA